MLLILYVELASVMFESFLLWTGTTFPLLFSSDVGKLGSLLH